MKLLSAAQMNEIDRLSSERFGVAGLILMENAGFQLFRELERHFAGRLRQQRVAVFCGRGNNGGDGFVLARLLDQHGVETAVYLLGAASDPSGDSRVNLEAWVKSGRGVHELDEETWESVTPTLGRFSVVVDALLGTGLRRPLGGLFARVVEELNRRDWFRLAVDIPSGMGADSLEKPQLCFRADLTVTFAAPQPAHFLNPAQECLGEIRVAPIGIPRQLLDSDQWKVSVITRDLARRGLPPRLTDSHKGSYGHVAVVAGSRGKPGAAALASWAALRAGSGLVTCFTSRSAQGVVATCHPEIMTEPLAESDEGALALPDSSGTIEQLSSRDTVAVGPGLGLAAETVAFVLKILVSLEVPVVLDADGINALEGQPEKLRGNLSRPLILTPHPREFSRLSGVPTAEIRSNRLQIAPRFSQDHQVWLVLKDYRTIIATPDGKTLVCPLGNPGMATAGSGDVLTGIIAALTGACWAGGRRSERDLTHSVAAGVYLHSLAGDAAARTGSMNSLTATSILDSLGQAFSDLERCSG